MAGAWFDMLRDRTVGQNADAGLRNVLPCHQPDAQEAGHERQQHKGAWPLLAGEQDVDQQDPKRNRGQHDGSHARRNRLLGVSQHAMAAHEEQQPAQARLEPGLRGDVCDLPAAECQQDDAAAERAERHQQKWRDRFQPERDGKIGGTPQQIDRCERGDDQEPSAHDCSDRR
jgi:hypothetical protein